MKNLSLGKKKKPQPTPRPTPSLDSKPPEPVSWRTEEFYYHPKSVLWYLTILLASIIMVPIPWLLSGRNDYISSAVILIAFIALTVYSSRKPQTRSYSLDNSKLNIDGQIFMLSNFSEYYVEVLDGYTQITLVGFERFSLPVGLYITDKELLKKIISVLSTQIPQTSPSNNPADWLARKIKL